MKKIRSYTSGWWMVLIITTLAASVQSDAGVSIYNAKLKQIVTSSTLKWTTLKKEATENYVIGAESSQGPIYLCRSRHEGDMLLGQLRPDYKSCAVSGTRSYEFFEVLENIENASLIIWKPWLKYHSKPSGAVTIDSSLDSVFIGRMKAESTFSHYIGRINYESTIGHLITFDDKSNEIVENSGEILIEVEPVSYKVENVHMDQETEHIRQSDPEVFDERILRNDDETAATVTTEIEYKYNYTLSWGHGHGIAIGLNTTIVLEDGTVLPQIEWANPYTEERKDLYKLEKYLEPGTACNVTFRGNYTNKDVQYTGKIITFYKDHESRSRPMKGERIENTVEVEAIYGEIYYVTNNTLVPTTTSTTTTTTTTTTTPPPQTAPPAPEENDIASPMKKPGPAELDTNDMLGDSSEEVMKTAKEDNISRSVVGGLGSKPNTATPTRIITVSLFIPVFALIL